VAARHQNQGPGMRDILFKNLISTKRKRKIIASRETFDQQGLHTVIQRHFIYTAQELVDSQRPTQIKPSATVRKQRDTRTQEEMFYCKIKGGVYTTYKERLFLIRFMHTLKIQLCATPAYQEKFF
jgi:hypothetical protein